jgi:oligopeptide transport system permease protein
LAARTLGATDSRIIIRHIFPNAIGTLITSLVLYIPAVIFSESTFSFLGIINYAELMSVGRLLSTGQSVMKESFYQVLFPSIFISLLMLSFNLFGNGLRDAFNPSLRGVEE